MSIYGPRKSRNSFFGSSGGSSVIFAPRGYYVDEDGQIKPEKPQPPKPKEPDDKPALTPAQEAALKRRKEERGYIGQFFDWITGNEPEAPKAYSPKELRARQGEITGQRDRLLKQAAEFDRMAKQAATSGYQNPNAPDRALGFIQRAERARAEAAALGNELQSITKTGVAVPKASIVRETAGALPRAVTAVAGIPGFGAELLGSGMSAIGVPGAEAVRDLGISQQEAVKGFGEDVFGAPSEALEYDATAKLATDVSGGVGSLLPFAAPARIAKAVGVAKDLQGAQRAEAIAKAARPYEYGLGIGQGGQQGSEDIRAYEARSGEKVGDATRFAALLLNAGLGATEVGVANRIFEGIPVAKRGAALEAVTNTIRRGTAGKVDPTEIGQAVARTLTNIEKTAPGRIGMRGAEEALQESGVQLGSNLIARGLYDEERDPFEGVGRAALVGGIVGGGVRSTTEIASVLGERAAANRQKAVEMSAQRPVASFELAIPNREDPTQVGRERVDVIGVPDAEGLVPIRRADGTLTRMTVDDLNRMRVPTEGVGAVPIPETFSKAAVNERLTLALGENADIDEGLSTYIRNVNTRLTNAMATTNTDEVEGFLKKEQGKLKRAKLPEETKIARMLVLDEAQKVNNEYLEFLTAPPQVETAAPAAQPDIAQEIAEQAQSQQAERAKRAEILQQTLDAPVVDKFTVFDDLMSMHGFSPNVEETTILRDYMRDQSDRETAAGQAKDAARRDIQIDRMNIVERVLYDDRIPMDAKIDRINTKLRKKKFKPINARELGTVYGYETAEAVFGSEGEYQKRLDAEQAQADAEQAKLDAEQAKIAKKRDIAFTRIVKNPAVKDKYRAFIGLADKNGWDGPNEQEMAVLRGDAAEIESLIPTPEDKLAQREGRAQPVVEEEDLSFFSQPDEDITEEDLSFFSQPEPEEVPENPMADIPVPEMPAPEAPVAEAPVAEAPVPEEVAPADVPVEAEGSPVEVAEPVQPAPPPPSATDAQRADAEALAQTVPLGEVVFQEGNTGLIRTNNPNNGKVMYLPFRGGVLGNTDITSYKGRLLSPGAKALLTSERDRLEQEAQDRHASEPFVQYDAEGIAFSPDIDPRMQGILRGWKKLILPDTKLYFSTVENAKENTRNFTGEHRRIGMAATQPDISGITQPIGPGEHYVLFQSGPNVSKTLEVIAHEMGHIHEVEAFRQATPEERKAILAEYEKWLLSQRGKKARDLVLSLRSRIAGRNVKGALDTPVERVPAYWTSFSEWYADQTARWAVSDAKPLTVVDKFFSRLARALHSFYKAVRAQRYLPTETFKKFIEKTTTDLDLTPFEVQEQQEELTYEDVLDEIEGAFAAYPEEGKPQEIDERAYRLLKQAAENKRASPEDLLAKLEEYKDKFAAEYGFQPAKGEVATEEQPMQAARNRIDAPSLNPDEDVRPVEEALQATPGTIENLFPANLSRPRVESIGFAANTKEKLKKLYDKLGRGIDDKYRDATNYSKALAASYGVTKLPDDMNVARKFELLESRKIGNQMRLEHTYLAPLRDLIDKLNLDPQDIGMYLWARSAKGRNALVRKTSEDVFDGSGMTDAEAQAVLDHYAVSGLTPKLQQVAKLHDKLVDYMLNEKVRAGLLSKSQRDALRKEQPFYTPLKGYALEGDMQVDGDPDVHSESVRAEARKNRKGVKIQEYIKARGRESVPFNPLFNLMTDAQFAIARIERNKVGRTFLDNVLGDPVSHKDIVKVYSTVKHPATTLLSTNALTAMNERARNGELFVVKKNGETYFLDFTRTPAGVAMERAFANMTPPQLHAFFQGIQSISNTIKSFKTRYNPVYLGTAAWMRDFSEAIITNYAAKGMKGGPGEGKAIAAKSARYIASLEGMDVIARYLGGTKEARAILKTVTAPMLAHRLRGKGPDTAEGEHLTLLFDQFLEDGGAVGHSNIMDAETMAEDTVRDIKRYAEAKKGNPVAAAMVGGRALLDAMDTASQVIDLQARFATYRAAIEAGVSRDDAASLALDSSLNLTRRGEWAPFLDMWFFFLSPSKEGARKLINQGRYGTLARKLFTKTVVMGGLLYLFNRFVMGGDDDEDGRPNILDVNNATAQSRIVLRYGEKTNDYVTIPVAFSMAYFNYVGGQITAASIGDISATEAGTNIMSAFINMASPIKADSGEGAPTTLAELAPDPIQPFADLIANRNFFGSPIYTKQGYQTTPRSELGREDTGAGWKMIARGLNAARGGTSSTSGWLDLQPEQYRYITEQYLGGLYGVGRDAVNLATTEGREGQTLTQRLPFVKSFVGKGGEFAPMNQYYKNTNKSFGLTSKPDMDELYAIYNDEDFDEATWAELEEKYPLQTDERIIDAYNVASSELKALRRDYQDGLYESREEYYADTNEVYKAFNRLFNEVKKERREAE